MALPHNRGGGDLFTEKKDDDDVTFVVEEKHLYFNRQLLMMCSDVFTAMLTTDMREKETGVIELKDIEYSNFVTFLKQLHPFYSWIPIVGKFLS
jgi:hypothetical protein